MKLYKNLVITFLAFITFVGCQSVKNTLTLKKDQSVDEFLIEKKNPPQKNDCNQRNLSPPPETASNRQGSHALSSSARALPRRIAPELGRRKLHA